MRALSFLHAAALVLLASACDAPPPLAPDAGTDAATAVAERIDDVPVTETLSLPGLLEPVDVIRDTRGIPHVYGANTDDVLRVEGYLVARDRFPQMELVRRNVMGTLAEVAGSLSPELADADRHARIMGYGRMGRAVFDSLPPGDPARSGVEAFTAGINAYVADLREGRASVPRGAEVLNLVVFSANYRDWEPAEVLAIARFQASSLHDYSYYEIQRTRALAGVRAAFGAPGGGLITRLGTFVDLYGMEPMFPVFTRAGFPTGDALAPELTHAPPEAQPLMRLPSIDQLDRALVFLDRATRARRAIFGEQRPGSNDWVVQGSRAEGGMALLANDPHLSLLSPPLWWLVHLDTARAGSDVEVMGVTLAGLPGVILGHNRHVAWGATVTTYDVTDVYEETITPGAGDAPDTVRFQGRDVPIETLHEIIRVADHEDVALDIEVVPHHGVILPDTRTETSALTVRWAGQEPSNELAGFLAMWRAGTVDEGVAALSHIEALTLNWVFADDAGDIAWSTRSRIPVRAEGTCTMSISASGEIGGVAPSFVLPGTGEHEWIGELPDTVIPHDRNPASGFLATANSDPVGVTLDGNPCNDAYYIGGGESVPGERLHRITAELESRMREGPISPDDMREIQAATQSTLGELMRDGIVEDLDRLLAPGPTGDPALEALRDAESARIPRLMGIRDRLAAWTLRTPHGIGASGADADDSVATTVFSVMLTRLSRLVLEDEVDRIGVEPSSYGIARFLTSAFGPEGRGTLATEVEAGGESVLFDDLRTPGVVETRAERVARAFLAALDFLDSRLGRNEAEWRWGRLHRAVFPSIVPALPGQPDVITIPALDDPTLAGGFPRGGDWEAVDVGNFSLWGATDFTYSEGPSMRFVAQLRAGAPVTWNALPGGELLDPDSPHHADEAALWRVNEAPRLWFEERDVAMHAEAHLRFMP